MAGIFWLRDFVDSLGHEIEFSSPKKPNHPHQSFVVQYVLSRSHRFAAVDTVAMPTKATTSKSRVFTSWWAVDHDQLDKCPEDVFNDFLIEVLSAKGSKKTIFLTDSKGGLSKRRGVLSAVRYCNLVDLPGPAIILSKSPFVPSPVPFLRGLSALDVDGDDPVLTKIPWHGEGARDYTSVRDYASVILVDPEVYCRGLDKAGYSYEVPVEMIPNPGYPRGFWKPPSEDISWRPGEPFHMSPKDYLQSEIVGDLVQEGQEITIEPAAVMDAMGECYCRILENAVHLAAISLRETDGQRGGIIVVRLSPHGARMGILNHPCYKAFKDAVGKLDKHSKREYGCGVIRIEQYW